MLTECPTTDLLMSDSFYSAIRPVDDFEAFVRPESYTRLPDDWSLVVADIVDSTGAIEAGEYKAVNTVGVSVIAAMIEISNATFEFDCAHGTIQGGILFDEDGSFETSGIWVSEGGPAPLEPPPELKAVFRGRVDGGAMDLEVDIIPREVTAGPYDLRRGETAVL